MIDNYPRCNFRYEQMVAVYKEMIRCEVAEKEMYLYGDDDNLAYFHEETKSFSYQCMFPPEILDSTMNYSIDLSIVQSQSIDDFEQYYYSDVTAAELVYVNEADSSGDEVWSENSTDLTVCNLFLLVDTSTAEYISISIIPSFSSLGGFYSALFR